MQHGLVVRWCSGDAPTVVVGRRNRTLTRIHQTADAFRHGARKKNRNSPCGGNCEKRVHVPLNAAQKLKRHEKRGCDNRHVVKHLVSPHAEDSRYTSGVTARVTTSRAVWSYRQPPSALPGVGVRVSVSTIHGATAAWHEGGQTSDCTSVVGLHGLHEGLQSCF